MQILTLCVVFRQIQYSFRVSTALAILLYVNPCLHPVIYATRYDVFRQSWTTIWKKRPTGAAICPRNTSAVNIELSKV